jgi:hypothetical protein
MPQEDCLEFSRMSRIDGFPDGFNLSTVNGMFFIVPSNMHRSFYILTERDSPRMSPWY